MVLKKLSNALSTYFMRSPLPWERPLLQLAASLQNGDAIHEDQLPEAPDALDRFLPLLSEQQLQSLIGLSSALATEAEKLDGYNPMTAQKHDLMLKVVQDASKIMHFSSRQPLGPNPGNFKAENLSCFLNWVNYAQPLWTRSQPESLAYLQNLVTGLAAHLTDPVLQHDAMEVFRDILETFTSFFQFPHMVLLAQIIYEHIRPRMLQGLQDQEPEVLPVAQLVIAYGMANVEQIAQDPHRVHGSAEIVQLLFAILEAPGYPGDDDEVSLHSIEFWNQYIEFVCDANFSREDGVPEPAWLGHNRAVCTRLATLLWSKLKTPPADVAQDWGDEEQEGFKEFRMDASDLMLSLFVFLGSDMLQQLIALILNALAQDSWLDIEAALYCINSLADNVLEDVKSEELLVQIFGSSLFRQIADFDKDIPSQTRRTAIDSLGAYGGYIERHAEFLPDTLRFLFASLENPGFHLSASKSIDGLCSTCRGSLTGELDSFIAQYNRFAQSATSEPYTNERVIGGIAAIIQAVSPESAKAQPLSALLDIVDKTVDLAKQLAAQGKHDEAHDWGVSAIDCLVRMGKSLQAPDDVPIPLDENSTSSNRESYWHSQEGRALQHRILAICHSILQTFPASGEVIDSICGVFKSGFTETEPGPFVFPPDFSVSFLEQCSVSTPRVESVLSMIMKLVVQHSRQNSPRIDAVIDRIYRKTAGFVQSLGQPAQDPGVAQCCIDIFARMVARYSNILLDVNAAGNLVQPILDFTLKAIDGPDLMPKRAAADFWTVMIKPQDVTADQTVRGRSEQVFNAYGPQLVQVLINQYAGRAQRSELDQLCEPLKVLVSSRPQVKGWLEAALTSDALPDNINPSVTIEYRRKFLQTIINLRGDGRKTRDHVKMFWAACRGTVMSYT